MLFRSPFLNPGGRSIFSIHMMAIVEKKLYDATTGPKEKVGGWAGETLESFMEKATSNEGVTFGGEQMNLNDAIRKSQKVDLEYNDEVPVKIREKP